MAKLFAGKRVKPLPCPFCGGKAAVVSVHPSATVFPHRVQCTRCLCETPGCRLPVSALLIWNKRVK